MEPWSEARRLFDFLELFCIVFSMKLKLEVKKNKVKKKVLTLNNFCQDN